jgi:hypothetical protein
VSFCSFNSFVQIDQHQVQEWACIAGPNFCPPVWLCRVENEDREPDQSLLAALETAARVALLPSSAATGPASPISLNWGGCVEAALVANLGRYRRYDYTSLRDLLRVVGGWEGWGPSWVG